MASFLPYLLAGLKGYGSYRDARNEKKARAKLDEDTTSGEGWLGDFFGGVDGTVQKAIAKTPLAGTSLLDLLRGVGMGGALRTPGVKRDDWLRDAEPDLFLDTDPDTAGPAPQAGTMADVGPAARAGSTDTDRQTAGEGLAEDPTQSSKLLPSYEEAVRQLYRANLKPGAIEYALKRLNEYYANRTNYSK